MLTGEIDTTYQTMQRDLFAGGLAARIGANAFAVWSAIKYHADFDSGHAWPSVRRLAEMTGMGKSSVLRAVEVLEAEHMLRKVTEGWSGGQGGRGGRTHTYIARERLDVRLGERVLCTVVLDYVPYMLADRLNAIKNAITDPKSASDEVWAHVEIIPGPGFDWDPARRVLAARLPAQEVARAVGGPVVTATVPSPEVRERLMAAKAKVQLKGSSR